jgi:hypothetical protein
MLKYRIDKKNPLFACYLPERNWEGKIKTLYYYYGFNNNWERQSPRNSMSPRSVRFSVWSWKLSNVGHSLDEWPKIYYLKLLRASKGTLSRWSRLHLQPLAPTNPHWARVVSYGPFSLCVIHKEGLCPSSGDINRLMMMMIGTAKASLWTARNSLNCVTPNFNTGLRSSLVWCPGQNKRIGPLIFFHGCRKRRLN